MSLAAIELAVRLAFPDVAQLPTAQLQDRLQQPGAVFLVDVRTPAEYEVSHLAGAFPFAPDTHNPAQWQSLVQQIRQAQSRLPAGQGLAVVAYCSVGYRSSQFVRELNLKLNEQAVAPAMQQPQARLELFNLRGSVFRWAREDRPLVNTAGPTRLVHGFAKPWSLLLPADRQYSP
jgi:rhodanese-related sulfurtransferase